MPIAKEITSNEIREIVIDEALNRIVAIYEYGLESDAIEDFIQSLIILGKPGVGKSALQKLAAREVADILSNIRKAKIELVPVSIRATIREAQEVVKKVAEGKAIPYIHLYLPQTKIWTLEGTPSPLSKYIEIAPGIKIPVNEWRLDPYMLPLLDMREVWGTPDRAVPAVLVLDEFNMARKEILETLFQLARGAELGRAKLNPLTVISLLGNTSETNIYAAKLLPSPLKNRAQQYVVTKVDLSGWMAYMREVYGEKYSREVEAFLLMNPEELYREDEHGSAGSKDIQTPRTWTQLAVRIYLYKAMQSKYRIPAGNIMKKIKRLANSVLLPDTAKQFIAFYESIKYVNPAKILARPEELYNIDKNSRSKSVVAYAIIKTTEYGIKLYSAAKTDKEKQRILKQLAKIMDIGYELLKAEAINHVLGAMPSHIAIALKPYLEHKMLTELRSLREKMKAVEEVLAKA